MSNPLVYVLLTRFKNKLLSIVKKPSQLIFVIVFAAMLGVSVFSGSQTGMHSFARPFEELLSLCLVLFGVSFVLTGFSGISKGASMFSMSDVNLLFSSPVKPIPILIYGLIQQMGTSLLLGFFILFQYTTIRNFYGVDFSFLVAVFLLYSLVSFCGQLTAMVIYILTSSDEKKRNIAKYSFIGVVAAGAGAIFVNALSMGQDDMLQSIVASASSFPVMLFPVIGWAKMILTGIFAENILYIVLGAVLILTYIVAMVVLVKVKQTDYYEDVLKATEVSFSAITAKKEGKLTEAVPQNVKVGKTGLGGGNGSDVFYYKHKVESRRAKAFIFDVQTLVYMAVISVFSFIFRNEGILPVLVLSIYLQMFSIALGRWVKELIMPYVYLIPEKPMKKLFNCLRESFVKIISEAVVLFIIVGLIVKLEPLEILGCILLRISCGILFTGVNLFCDRFFGGISVKALTLILYFLFAMIFALPAIITAVILYQFTYTDFWIIYLVSAIVNTLSGVLTLFVSRNVLQYAELNNR